MWKSFKQQDYMEKQVGFAKDYENYHFSIQEWMVVFLEWILLIMLIGLCFYDSWIACLCLSPGFIWFVKYQKENKKVKQKQLLRVQFKDAVLSVASNQKAGYSVENAFIEAYSDMKMLYGEKSLICEELLHIHHGLRHNLTLEKMLLSLGERSHIPDILEFGEVFLIAKRSGGNITSVIDMVAQEIEEKIDVEQEIQVLISSKEMEANVMSVIPFVLILYMSATSEGFFDPLYHNLLGIGIMSVCLGIYIVAFFLTRKIIAIQV